MKVWTSTIHFQLEGCYDAFVDRFGIGPCGALAALLRERGWGDVAVCLARDGAAEFAHYVVWSGGIVDMANPFDRPLSYSSLEILDADEMPECVGREEIDWLAARVTES